MSSLEQRVQAIEERNRRVEQDKAWETSWTRRLSVVSLTYVVVVCYLLAIDADRPLLNALVPAVGFLLSTLVMKVIRKLWE